MQTYRQMGANRAEMEVAEPLPQNRRKICFSSVYAYSFQLLSPKIDFMLS